MKTITVDGCKYSEQEIRLMLEHSQELNKKIEYLRNLIWQRKN